MRQHLRYTHHINTCFGMETQLFTFFLALISCYSLFISYPGLLLTHTHTRTSTHTQRSTIWNYYINRIQRIALHCCWCSVDRHTIHSAVQSTPNISCFIHIKMFILQQAPHRAQQHSTHFLPTIYRNFFVAQFVFYTIYSIFEYDLNIQSQLFVFVLRLIEKKIND